MNTQKAYLSLIWLIHHKSLFPKYTEIHEGGIFGISGIYVFEREQQSVWSKILAVKKFIN